MAQPLKLATPPATVTGPTPPAPEHVSAPPPGLVPMARVTVVVLSAVSTLPFVSATATDAANEPVPVAWMFAPEAGWLVSTSLVAAPGVMLKLLALLGAVRDGLLVAATV